MGREEVFRLRGLHSATVGSYTLYSVTTKRLERMVRNLTYHLDRARDEVSALKLSHDDTR